MPEAACRYILETNAQYRFGALNCQPNGTVVFELTLMEEGLTLEMLGRMIRMLGASADEIGEELSKRIALS